MNHPVLELVLIFLQSFKQVLHHFAAHLRVLVNQTGRGQAYLGLLVRAELSHQVPIRHISGEYNREILQLFDLSGCDLLHSLIESRQESLVSTDITLLRLEVPIVLLNSGLQTCLRN